MMVRGIERTALFRDDRDHAEFVARIAALAEAGAWMVYAWGVTTSWSARRAARSPAACGAC
jgi:hypothetical protein